MGFNEARLCRLNADRIHSQGEYVLYWAQIYRRLERNHALDYALRCSAELGKPLVVYEGLRLDYPWASPRLHPFVLEGMQAHAARVAQRGLNYWPFVETPGAEAGRGLVARLASRAALVVTDDFPCFIVPGQSEALARRADVPVLAVDGNGIVPLSLLGPPVGAAAHLRPRIHKVFAEAWPHRAAARRRVPAGARQHVPAPFETWSTDDVDTFTIPARATVEQVKSYGLNVALRVRGGS